MKRSRRTLLRVTISEDMNDLEQSDLDAREAARIFRLLMGDNVEQRGLPILAHVSDCRLTTCTA